MGFVKMARPEFMGKKVIQLIFKCFGVCSGVWSFSGSERRCVNISRETVMKGTTRTSGNAEA